MKVQRRTHFFCAALALTVLFAEGCKKKPIAIPPPAPTPSKEAPPAPPKRPGVQFTAEPASVSRGEAATLRWSVTDADSIRIEPGVGVVQASGSRQAFPTTSTTYKLTATGPGGTTEANAYVNVAAAVATPPEQPKPGPSVTFSERLEREVGDIYFDYNQSEIREDARAKLQQNTEALKSILAAFPNDSVAIQAHCDERGSAEYNLGLGDRRGASARDFLIQLGVPANRLRVVSFGKERPQCTEATESCWQLNRRAHFAPGQ
jgi:peptidoglycan-associated lipoprotein